MIDGDTPGVKPCNWIFDPGVVIDDNGTGYIAFGGGDPQPTGSKLWPGNSRIAKLKPSMTAIDGSAVKMPAPYLFEASELNMMNGRFVYTYNTSWSDRNDWNKFEKRNGQPAPTSCSMCYMVSDTPLEPDSWEYRGEYVPNEGSFNIGSDWGNNHTHLHKYQDKYYLFYHGNVLEKSMKNAGVMDNSASGYRSLCVDQIDVNEDTQTIRKITMTQKGVSPIKPLDPYQLHQAETMASCGGISYEDFKNTTSASSVSTLGNDASKNLYIKMAAGSWTAVRNVDFGQTGAKSLVVRAKGTGTVEIRTGRNSQPLARMEFSSTEMKDHVVSIDPSVFKDTKTFVFIVFTQAENVQFDSWQFSESDASGIATISDRSQTPLPSAQYDLNGHRLSDANHHGLVIERYQDVNGTTRTRKHIK
jgi:arabinoxylan arabinofuranohydrolase